MSAVCILAPIVISAWPGFSATVVAAAASMGYVVVKDATSLLNETRAHANAVELDIAQSEIVTGQLDRDQRLSVSRDGITVTFSRDERGKAALCVTGKNRTKEELRAAGEELSNRVVQKYVYERLMQEMNSRGYNVVEETTEANHSIRLKVRHWEN